MRVFEAMSCGRLLLTDRANGILDIFSDKKHLIVYNENNLEELILYYLDNSEEREKIAKSGYNEVVEKHTYEKRLEKILKISLN
jgi:spore maturation protein CgeB